ncbi:MAG: sugar transferase [Candidatus Liptonbacteria bacterium]|nr:sugar transferase [Candidatus Liptonbacteria bacterium]
MTSLKIIFLLVGDLASLYVSLIGALFIRYGGGFSRELVEHHLIPFSLIFAVWILLFYTAGLYDLRKLRNGLEFFKTLLLAFTANALVTIMLFYLIPFFGIAPKTNLFIFLGLFAVLEALWRRIWNNLMAGKEAPNKFILIGEGRNAEELRELVTHNPQLGYELKEWVPHSSALLHDAPAGLQALCAGHAANLVVVDDELKETPSFSKELYQLFKNGIEVKGLSSTYELLLKKVPLENIRENWVIDNISGQAQFYDSLKRSMEIVAALLLGIVLLPLELLVAVLILLTSPTGPAVCAQTRTGFRGKTYTHYKFRTMRSCHEKEQNGPQWKTVLEGKVADPRLTAFGRLLVHTHLDELPQLINILKGEMSFVGPRPERPQFVEMLREKLPYYDVRHMVKPGVTGWAQVNYRYAASVADTSEKLSYDLYYVKNRSLILDLAIVLKTLKTLFITPR